MIDLPLPATGHAPLAGLEQAIGVVTATTTSAAEGLQALRREWGFRVGAQETGAWFRLKRRIAVGSS